MPSKNPTGFRLKAQGCEEQATLGHRSQTILNRNAVAAIPYPQAYHPGHNAVDDVSISGRGPKVAPKNRGNLGLKDTIPLGLNRQTAAQN